MRKLMVGLVAVAVVGCSSMTETDAGTPAVDAGPVDAGPQPIRYTTFTLRAQGWPSGAKLVGAGVQDNVLIAATDQGVFKLPAIDTTWQAETTPVMGDAKPTSLLRVDQSLVMTTAGTTGGAIFTRAVDGTWAQVMGPPPNPEWALVKKSNEYLLATTGGLFVSTALTGPWTRRSAANTPLFTKPLSQLVAAASQQKLFAHGDAANALGALYESNDVGATWAKSAVMGDVKALGATGAVVLVAVTTDGQQRSDNYGNTFRPVSAPLTDPTFFVTQDTTFWAGTSAGLLRSDDLGVSFSDASNGLPAGPVKALVFAGGYVIAMTDAGPWLNQVP